MSKRWLLNFKKINGPAFSCRRRHRCMVRNNVTSCTEETLWQDAGRWWCQEFLCEWWQLTRPVHAHLPPGSRIILTADKRLWQELIQFCTFAVTTKSGQIRSKFWPEPDLAGFPKKGRMPDLPEPKSGTSLIMVDKIMHLKLWKTSKTSLSYSVLCWGRYSHRPKLLGTTVLLTDDFRVEKLLQVRHQDSTIKWVVDTTAVDCQLQKTVYELPRNTTSSTCSHINHNFTTEWAPECLQQVITIQHYGLVQ